MKIATTNQLLKAFGHLPRVHLDDVNDVGIAADQLGFVTERKCGHPDFADDEIADADDPQRLSFQLALPVDACESLIEQHKRMRRVEALNYFAPNERGAAKSTTGTGSFPPNCYPDEYPDRHAVTYFLDRDTFPEHYTRNVLSSELDQLVEAAVWGFTREQVFDLFDSKPMLDVAMTMVNEQYRRVGCAHIEKHDGPNGSHNIHIKSVAIAGPTIGVAWFNNGTCSDHVNNHIDSTYRPGLMGTCKLIGHECGHNHDLGHTFSGQSRHRGVMSYSPPRLFYGFSTGEGLHVLPRDPSLDQLQRQYGTEEVGKAPWTIDEVEPPADWQVVNSWEDGVHEWQTRRRRLSTDGNGIVWH